MYNVFMNEDKVISRRKSQKLSKEVTEDLDLSHDESLDTVAVLCMAVVTKAEYDEMQVQNIAPIEVHGADDQKVVINPFLLVGSSEDTRKEALKRIHRIWDTYDHRKASMEAENGQS